MSKNIIHPNVIIGNYFRIGKFNVIGDDGFGFETESDNKYKYPLTLKDHPYGVIIRDNVWIKNNVCIDRGRWRNTIIGNHCKIDNNVHIAHNVQMGENNLIVAGTVIGGSVTMGDRNFLGINCSIKQGIKIGSDCVIGMGAVVTKDVPDNITVVGNPAKPLIKISPELQKIRNEITNFIEGK